jgi:hypothetical protein
MNINYKSESEFLKKVEDSNDNTNKKELLSDEQLNIIIEKHPNVPQDYVAYLREIGAGNFRESQFVVQSFLFNLETLGLDEHYEIKSNIWFFGDNYCGDFSGFDLDLNDGLVVEFLHEFGEVFNTNKTFKQYIRDQMLIDENGKDLRGK